MASPPPALDSLRLQLEGRWTCFEQARARETRLLQLLGSWRWRRHQSQWLPLLGEVRAHEPQLQAVRTYVEERAAQEQWPRAHPGPAALGELRTRRAALRKTIHRRLEGFAPRDDVPLATLLDSLESRALEPEPPPPSPEEFILAQGWGLSGARPGRYWLMAKRLLWRPWKGTPVQVQLTSPREESRRWELPLIRHARALVTLLTAHQDIAHSPSSPLDDEAVVMCPASLHPEGFPNEPRWGVAIFRPHHVTFVPTHRPSLGEHFRRLLTKAIPVIDPMRLLWLQASIERLRRLPPPRLDAAVTALHQLRAGQQWPETELRRAKHVPEAIQFKSRGYVLSIPRAQQPNALQPFLERHVPHAVTTPRQSSGPEWRTPWRQPLFWHRSTIIAGFFLQSMYLQRVLDPTLHVPMGRMLYGVGYLALAWTCMRYAKARGFSPLVGLVGSACNMLGVIIVIMLPARGSPDTR